MMQLNPKSQWVKNLVFFFLAILVADSVPILLYKFGLIHIRIYDFINFINFTSFYIFGIVLFVCVLLGFLYIVSLIRKNFLFTKKNATDILFHTIRFYSFVVPIVIVIFTLAIDNLFKNNLSGNTNKISTEIIVYTLVLLIGIIFLLYQFYGNIRKSQPFGAISTIIILWLTFFISNQINGAFFERNSDYIIDKNKFYAVAKKYREDHKSPQLKKEDDLLIETTQNVKMLSPKEYEYTLSDDYKLELYFPKQKLKKFSRILFDGRDIKKNLLDYNQTHYVLSPDYKVKPGSYELTFVNTEIISIKIGAQYIYDSILPKTDIEQSWYYKNKSFVTITEDGLLLRNNSSKFDSFGFKRRFEGDVSFEIEFIPVDVKTVDMSIFFGEKTYFVFNNKNINVMQKENTGKDKRQKSVTYSSFKSKKLHKVLIKRENKKYYVYIDNVLKLEYEDNNTKGIQIQKFRNIGITLPKGSMSVLVKKITVK
ncbi:MAG: hypothetical protein Q7T77_11580 [Sulfuricurvum sp.]|nr:hypothetical protein [Sulfuricurvum sp.]